MCSMCTSQKKSESQNISLFSSRIKVKAYSSHFSLLDRTPVLKPTVACFSHVLTFHNHISCQKGRKQFQHSTLHFFQDGDVNGMKSSSDPEVWFLENVEKQHEAENVWNKKVWLDFSVWSLRFLLWWLVRVRFLHVDTCPSQSCPAIGRRKHGMGSGIIQVQIQIQKRHKHKYDECKWMCNEINFSTDFRHRITAASMPLVVAWLWSRVKMQIQIRMQMQLNTLEYKYGCKYRWLHKNTKYNLVLLSHI